MLERILFVAAFVFPGSVRATRAFEPAGTLDEGWTGGLARAGGREDAGEALSGVIFGVSTFIRLESDDNGVKTLGWNDVEWTEGVDESISMWTEGVGESISMSSNCPGIIEDEDWRICLGVIRQRTNHRTWLAYPISFS